MVRHDIAEIKATTKKKKPTSALRAERRQVGGSYAAEDADAEDDNSDDDVPEVCRNNGFKVSSVFRVNPNLRTHYSPQAALRQHLKRMLCIKSYKELPEKCPPLTDDEIVQYRTNHAAAPKCTADKFRIDFEHTWKNFSFNGAAALVFGTDFIKAVTSGIYAKHNIPIRLLTYDNINIVLDKHMKHVRERYSHYLKHSEGAACELDKVAQKRRAKNSRQKTVSRMTYLAVSIPMIAH